MLELKKVAKSFQGPRGQPSPLRQGRGQVQALKDVSLSVSPGELVVVQGPSGCGKTTLLLTAGGLLKPDTGEVLINGQDPYRMGPNQRSVLRAQRIGFVFQQFHLVPYLSVLDNVLAPSVARAQPNSSERAQQLIQHFKIEDRINHVPSQLSTGERQRTALARALLNSPEFILADEPTGNLDEENGKIVLGFLSEFVSNGGAVLLVTHDTNISQFAHRNLRLFQGEIIRSE